MIDGDMWLLTRILDAVENTLGRATDSRSTMKSLREAAMKNRGPATRRTGHSAALALLACWIALPASAADPANAAYSNVRLIKSEGDLIGWRIQVVHSAEQVFVLVQGFEGVALEPCLLPAKLEGQSLSFALEPACKAAGNFNGVLRNGTLTGSFDSGIIGPDGKREMKLTRIRP